MNATQFFTKGNGTAIHMSYGDSSILGATYCDKFGGSSYNLGGNRKGRINQVVAEVATCKRCLKIAKAGA